ncbi:MULTISPECIES: SRPBCC domain-containing protein [unclassified Microbacterium]|uniref:SRPBCC family protein n=1 Tax=unclassified Microbacterium TaxID=2609290 RepID=UPI00214BB29D|nr:MULTISPECIES: SRPBCC domain-containing protein [unclassified Microbacterium]MCR2783096.1 SRPBCC domain-containing protein [Microbacterium sp. zg.B96]MDL5352120.1 SRPBCC domain-containing protein [Microbacterium sp. zg-YB36]WIM16020.1 SRPBCC domain-containing protein [Microbacterium sp. zg-B96]
MTDPTGSTVTRTFAAPPEAVFDAWVTPASFVVWWGGSDIEVPLDSVSLDVRPGGTWKATMILGHGMPDFHWRGEYLEVDRPNKLVMTMTDEPGDARELLTVTLTAVDGGTEMTFSQTGGHLSPEQYEGTTVGWQRAFDSLDTVLSARRSTVG